MPAWLTAPDPPLMQEDGLPDPWATIGRHVRWVCVRGVPLSHGDWTRTHEGACPPGCRTLPDMPPAQPFKFSFALAAWRAFIMSSGVPPVGGLMARPTVGIQAPPLNSQSEREVILPLQLSGEPY